MNKYEKSTIENMKFQNNKNSVIRNFKIINDINYLSSEFRNEIKENDSFY